MSARQDNLHATHTVGTLATSWPIERATVTCQDGERSSVWVYAFLVAAGSANGMVTANLKATLPAIERRGAKPLPLTGEQVDASEVGPDGTWYRVATGWGARRE